VDEALATLRRRVQRFTSLSATLKKLFAPTLEKALTFLDDTLLPSMSIAWSIACARKRRSVHALRWTCGVKPKLKGVNKLSKRYIMRVQDEYNPASLLQSPQKGLLFFLSINY